jgi:peptidoglycan hydrolase-like amidase
MTQDKKFKREWYHASDDPDVFQKYLGYGLEERSPNINKVVDETKNLVILFDNKLIKPWYSSRTN